MVTGGSTSARRSSATTTSSSNSSSHKISTFELRERLKKSRDEAAENMPTVRVPKERRRSKKIVIKKKDGSFALVNQDPEKKMERKNSVKDCLQKYQVETSLRGINKDVPPDPYVDDDNKSLGTIGTSSLSLGSAPPPRDEQRNVPSPTFEKRANSSMELSLDLSSHPSRIKGESGGVGDISTAASEEQWARFKLLGRTGLGEIKLSAALRTLIDRNFEILRKTLKNIAAIRDDMSTRQSFGEDTVRVDFQTGHLLDEVRETIDINVALAELKRDPDTIDLNPKVETQLRDYITVISSMYRDNAFHNFEHASTVLAAVMKLMGLVARPDDMDFADMKYGCGVTNDPWIQFALVFSALIHDVDHAGVSNAQLIKEKSLVAGAYKNRSVAEQNSIELAWNLLMEPCYKEFRETIFATPSECSRFRGLVVTAVMATDIADKELASLRKDRAAEAINSEVDDPDAKLISQKATYVVETLIQAADISHTMQSFQMYKKWNHKLFREMYDAYKSGRAEKDPSEFWYNGEFGFFDFYIVPLCKKLQACGIFEKASEDYLNNAHNNRKTWETMGEDLVAGYLREYNNELAEKRPESRGTATTVQSDDPYDSEESPLDTDFDSFGDDSSDDDDDDDSFAEEPTPKTIVSPQPRKGTKAAAAAAAQAKKEKEAKKIIIPRWSKGASAVRLKRVSQPRRCLSDSGKKVKKGANNNYNNNNNNNNGEKKEPKSRRIVYRSKNGNILETEEALNVTEEPKERLKRRIRSKSADIDSSGHSTRSRIRSKAADLDNSGHSTRSRIRSKSVDIDTSGHSTRSRIRSKAADLDNSGHSTRSRIRSKSVDIDASGHSRGGGRRPKQVDSDNSGHSTRSRIRSKSVDIDASGHSRGGGRRPKQVDSDNSGHSRASRGSRGSNPPSPRNSPRSSKKDKKLKIGRGRGIIRSISVEKDVRARSTSRKSTRRASSYDAEQNRRARTSDRSLATTGGIGAGGSESNNTKSTKKARARSKSAEPRKQSAKALASAEKKKEKRGSKKPKSKTTKKAKAAAAAAAAAATQ